MSEGKFRKSLHTKLGKLGWLLFILGAIKPIRWLFEVVSDVLTLKTIYPGILVVLRRVVAIVEHPLFTLVFLVVGLVLIIRSLRRPQAAVSAAVAPTPLPSPPADRTRIYLGPAQTPEWLLGLRSGKTTAEGNRAVEPYIGKWITVRDRIDDVIIGSSPTITFARSPFHLAYLWVRFDDTWKARIEVLTKGQEIVVRGQIKEISGASVALGDCELVE